MISRHVRSLRLHEWAFGLFLLITAGRLLVAGGFQMAEIFAIMASTIPLMAAMESRWPRPANARLRLILFPVLVNLAYPQLGKVMSILGHTPWDAKLLRWDRALFGETPSILVATWHHPAASEFMSTCYVLFFPAVLSAFVIAVYRADSRGVKLFNGLITIYAIGFLGYTLVPAAGPHLTLPDWAAHAPTGGAMTAFNAKLVAEGSNRVDVFPSLHLAITTFLMGLLWKHARRSFFVLLNPALGLGLATLYLGYHYAVDLLAGLLLAATGWWFTSLPLHPNEPNPPL
jgi:membrane-associated phospholipid phosphatase